MRTRRFRRHPVISCLAALLLLPLTAWSALPGMAAVADFCPMPEAVEAAMHGCCPSDPAVSPSPGHHPVAHPHHETQGAAVALNVAPVETGGLSAASGADDCACLPADGRPSGSAGMPAATMESSTPRVPDVPGAIGSLPSAIEAREPNRVSRCPDESRRLAAAPPLFLLHELLLI